MSHGKCTRRWRQRRVRNRDTLPDRLDREFRRRDRELPRLDVAGAQVKLPFGRHKGQPIGTVARSYLHWFLREIDGHESLKSSIAQYLKGTKKRKRRRSRRKGSSRTATTSIPAAFRADEGSEAPF